MPVQTSYPGVYVEEVPSGVKTISGVSTSIAAFIGSATKGHENEPTTIFNYGDYERVFGGLSNDSPMSFAVRDFFQHGGGEAIIVRVTNSVTKATKSFFDFADEDGIDTTSAFKIEASSSGVWGDGICFWIDYKTKTDPDNELFNLFIEDKDGKSETFLNLSIVENSPVFAINVLKQKSELIGMRKLTESATSILRPAASSVDGDGVITKQSLSGGGDGADISSTEVKGSETDKTGLYALEKTDIFNILCIPPYSKTADIEAATYNDVMPYCKRRRAVLLIDCPSWGDIQAAITGLGNFDKDNYAALYFPRLLKPNPLKNNQIEEFVPCGAVAGVLARTDTERGVWKAPAGTEANLSGVSGFSVPLTDQENGKLNQLGINCLRSFPVYGKVVWGARTLQGADVLASEWKYLPVRRTALYIEESLFRGLKWVVFEPNDEPLWGQIRLNVGAFMHNMFRQGAFQGQKKDAYFVKCDSETTTQNDINLGAVNIVVGFAPLKPAEFVILKIQQIAGQIDV
ncbi:phage tail sheath family protein [Gelidibacter salicanalis]|uniref:Phage tail sheath family protein n=1 Tax=Gelidibacter salicanalis TaxID=291193 RepID=A0A5C7APU2_9FLAO|nr:phage tail sheath C-terminal domain-containing protein [Gelidibacter salicanalis]TXE07842.1 phage tail sheath family protein [Gelidibacter salicanalis]